MAMRQGENKVQISVLHLSEEEKRNFGIYHWPVSTIEASLFAWHHEKKEECYILEGEVEVTTPDGKKVNFTAGDFVIFPKGISCICHVKKSVRRHCHYT